MSRRKRYSGSLDRAVLQAEIDAIRERMQGQDQAEAALVSRARRLLGGEDDGHEPYALAGLAGRKRTPRPRKWRPTPTRVDPDSTGHRAKDTRFNRPAGRGEQ